MLKWIAILCVCFTSSIHAEAIKVLAFAGSTREDSVNKKLVVEAADLARQMGAEVTVIDLKDYTLPLYDGDLETKSGMPENAKKLKSLMADSQVIFIASPSYNGSISGVLKNAIDWATRSEKNSSSREAFKGKKFVIMSASPSPTGGSGALNHLRSIIENIGGTVLVQQISVPDAYNAFDPQGHLKNQTTKNELKQLVQKSLN